MTSKNSGAGRPDMTRGNKVEPTTKVPKPKKPHAGHGHKGKST